MEEMAVVMSKTLMLVSSTTHRNFFILLIGLQNDNMDDINTNAFPVSRFK